MGANAQTTVPAFTAGAVLTAVQQTQINTGIPVFATTTTRDAAFGGTGEKILAQGQYAYIEASNTLQVYTASAWTDVVSTSAWTAYTPTVTSSGGTITTVGAVSGYYQQVGKTMFVYFSIVITTVGTATGQLRFTLPVNSNANVQNDTVLGSAREQNLTGETLQAFKSAVGTCAMLRVLGSTIFSAGNGLTVRGSITYEVA
jgi:hypothetical protein